MVLRMKTLLECCSETAYTRITRFWSKEVHDDKQSEVWSDSSDHVCSCVCIVGSYNM